MMDIISTVWSFIQPIWFYIVISILGNIVRIHLKRLSNEGDYNPHENQSLLDYLRRFWAWIRIQFYRHTSRRFQYIRRQIVKVYEELKEKSNNVNFYPPSYEDMLRLRKWMRKHNIGCNDGSDGTKPNDLLDFVSKERDMFYTNNEWSEEMKQKYENYSPLCPDSSNSINIFTRDGMPYAITHLKGISTETSREIREHQLNSLSNVLHP